MKINLKTIFMVLSLVIVFQGTAQLPSRKISRSEYIKMYKELAMDKMREYGIPASITLAQGLLESSDGNSILATKGNNHFGIKCHKGWNGKKIHYDDDKKNECFRKYKTAEQSYRDHSEFLTNRNRYAFLFELDIMDYKAWAKGLKKAGYATNPKYPQLLIRIIEENNLHKYDLMAMNKLPEVKEEVMEKKMNGRYARGYHFPNPSDFRELRQLNSGRLVYKNNGVEFVFVKQGDSFLKLAMEVGVDMGKLQKYNDMGKSDKLFAGQMLYLKKKKRKAKKKYHKIESNESLYSVSQLHGVRLKSLLWKNRIKKNQQAPEGFTLWLKKRKPKAK